MNEWKFQAISTTGRGHIAKNMPCQDSVFCYEFKDVKTISVSDGAGSMPHSEEGAKIAAKTAAILMAEQFDMLYNAPSPEITKRIVIGAIRKAIAEKALELNLQPKELACTLLVCGVQKDRFLMLHIGDGIVVCQKEGHLKLVSAPNNGEFANSTVFVTSDNVFKSAVIRRGIEPLLEGFCLMSDGCERTLYDKRNKRPAPFISRLMLQCQLFNRQSADEWLLEALENLIAARTCDDCSLAFLTRSSENFGNWQKMQPKQRANLLGIYHNNKNKLRRAIRKEAKKCGICN